MQITLHSTCILTPWWHTHHVIESSSIIGYLGKPMAWGCTSLKWWVEQLKGMNKQGLLLRNRVLLYQCWWSFWVLVMCIFSLVTILIYCCIVNKIKLYITCIYYRQFNMHIHVYPTNILTLLCKILIYMLIFLMFRLCQCITSHKY